ncbi:MAG TPA: O-antigen translocase [Vicinamibacterales bacterium]
MSAPATSSQSTYGQVLKSSALVGGSSLVNIFASIVRVKAMAVLLGPAGFGLMGLLVSISELTRSLAGLGVNSSGVRQIAAAVGTGDTQRIALTAAVLRRVSFVLATLGAVTLIVFARPIAQLSFGHTAYAGAVALLSLEVFLRIVGDGQGALLAGFRRIADMVRAAILGAIGGTAATVVLVYFFRESGIVPALITVAAMSLVFTWAYSRRVSLEPVSPTLTAVRTESFELLKLGLAFMTSGLVVMGVGYVIRIVVLRALGIEAAGFYQSAWSLGGLYVGFVLQAMGADFYPRLTAVAYNNAECNRLVNEQTEVGLLLAGPGVLGTLVFAPLVVWLFYSPEFAEAVPLLRWFCIGMMVRVICWPLGFVLMAKNLRHAFVGADVFWALSNLALSTVLVWTVGLAGAGIAFILAYVLYTLLVRYLVSRASGFTWSQSSRRLIALFVLSVLASLTFSVILPPLVSLAVNSLLVVAAGYYSARSLIRLLPWERLPGPVRWLARRLWLAPAA